TIGGMQDEDYLELGRRLRPPQFDAMPPDLRELGPSYRAADPDGTRHWIELERMSRQSGAPAQPLRNRMTFSMLESIKMPALLICMRRRRCCECSRRASRVQSHSLFLRPVILVTGRSRRYSIALCLNS